MSGGSSMRLPIAPPEQPLPEDDRCAPWEPLDIGRIEHLLEDWMIRLERRMDRIAERVSQPQPRQQVQPQQPQQQQQQQQVVLLSSMAQRPAATKSKERCALPSQQEDARPSAAKVSEAASGEEEEASEAHSTRSSDPDRPTRRKSVQEWVREEGARTMGFHMKATNTAEMIANHYDDLEKCANPGRNGSMILRVVTHKWFDLAITCVVLFSAIMVGVQVDYEARNFGDRNLMFQYAEIACASVFTIELALRIFAMGLRRLCSTGERPLFMLDIFLVFAGWIDIIVSLVFTLSDVGANSFIGRLVGMAKMGRLVRLVRTVRFLSELRVMAFMIFNSLRSLMWLFCILVALAYCFGLVITQGASTYLTTADVPAPHRESFEVMFGSVMRTMYSLLKAMTGGVNWGEVADLIAHAGWFYRVVVCIYMFINLFSVLNIVTGVFVDGAIELGKRDRVMMIQKQGKKREAFAQHLVQLLREMDRNTDGVITRDEFLASFDRADVKEFMQALSIDLDDASNMFTLLDRNMDGMVDIVEFVMGMEKLRGEAKSSDIHFLIMQCQHIMDMLMRFGTIHPPEGTIHPPEPLEPIPPFVSTCSLAGRD